MKFIKIFSYIVIFICSLYSKETLTSGEQVFRAYCWGCHHQSATAFGPSFKKIANSRTKDQMITHIMAPTSNYKELGYKRTVMPSFSNTLSEKEIDLIIDFINSCKDAK